MYIHLNLYIIHICKYTFMSLGQGPTIVLRHAKSVLRHSTHEQIWRYQKQILVLARSLLACCQPWFCVRVCACVNVCVYMDPFSRAFVVRLLSVVCVCACMCVFMCVPAWVGAFSIVFFVFVPSLLTSLHEGVCAGVCKCLCACALNCRFLPAVNLV